MSKKHTETIEKKSEIIIEKVPTDGEALKDIETFLEGYKDKPLEEVIPPEIIEESDPGLNVDINKPSIELPKVKRGRKPKQKPVVISGELISGALFIMLIDLTIPQVISMLNNRFSDTKIDANLLRLNQKQKDELQPLADQVVKQLEITGNPLYIFVLSMLGIYGLNFAMLKQTENIGK